MVEAIGALGDDPPAKDAPNGDHGAALQCVSAGGDFVLGGERRFQAMHSDLGSIQREQNVRLPPPLLAANFCVQEIDGDNGPMRMVPKTQLQQGCWKNQEIGEPAAWRGTRLFPAPVGSFILRDVRTLHGGSPNFTDSPRFLPAIEFVSERFLRTPRGRSYVCKSSMPRKLYDGLRRATQRRVCPDVVAVGDVKATFRST